VCSLRVRRRNLLDGADPGGDLLEELNELNSDGFRVLAVANKKVEKRAAYSKADEDGLVLTGYLAFLDPPKETAAKAISG
jgi:Cation transport ATPase